MKNFIRFLIGLFFFAQGVLLTVFLVLILTFKTMHTKDCSEGRIASTWKMTRSLTITLSCSPYQTLMIDPGRLSKNTEVFI